MSLTASVPTPPRPAASAAAGGARAGTDAARAATRAALADGVLDLLVIGGGITGAGVARDAAARGLRVGLVERDDLGSGTSSRSSRLVHGGVRYLEHGHLALVFEASRERRTLLRTAPHLVRPLRFTWPVWRGARVPRWKLAAGLALYDALALFRNVGAHRVRTAAGVRALEPGVRADALVGGATYWDAATDDARLTLATARAAADAGALVLTHAEATALALAAADAGRAAPRAARASVVRVHDRVDGTTLEVRARAVVNAAGPWGDAVQRLVVPDAPRAVLGAKGVHLAVPAARVGNRGALTLVHPRDGRVLFVLPAGAFTIVGTTETPASAGPDDVRADVADVAYLLAAANHAFPAARLDASDVVSAWAGLRPLAAAAVGAGGTGAASREHAIAVDARGLVTVSGGKLTTYRAMAAEIVDACAPLLGASLPPSRTADAPLPGGDLPGDPATRTDADGHAAALDALVAEAARATGDAAVARRLVHAHGTAWRDVAALADPSRGGDAALATPLVDGLPYLGAEVAWAARAEWGTTLADVLMRRLPVAYETRDAGRAAARRAAALLAPTLGWDEHRVARELAAYDGEAARVFGIDER